MPSRKSPPRLHAGERRQQLIDAALDCFSRRGFQGATTREIAAAAGVTEAIVFRHFPTKQDLYLAVLDTCKQSGEAQACREQLEDCMARNDDRDLLRTIARAILDDYRRDARLNRILFFAALEGHEALLAYHRQISFPVYERLSAYIQRRQKDGKLAGYDSTIILVAISGMATQFATLTQLFGYECKIPDSEVAESFTSIMIAGLQPSKKRISK